MKNLKIDPSKNPGLFQNEAVMKEEPCTIHNSITKRTCHHCGLYFKGNGVRKPLFTERQCDYDDIIYCCKKCHLDDYMTIKQHNRHSRKFVTSAKDKKVELSELQQQADDDRSKNVAASSTPSISDDMTSSVKERRGRGRRKWSHSNNQLGGNNGEDGKAQPCKRYKGTKWKRWTLNTFNSNKSINKTVDADYLLSKYSSTLKLPPHIVDKRVCVSCNQIGDGETNGVGRLLNLDVDKWVHLNCALWSHEVYEIQCGALLKVEEAMEHGKQQVCSYCQLVGATVRCHRNRCPNVYHCGCALKAGCQFFINKTILCPQHVTPIPQTAPNSGQTCEILTNLAVFRKVYIQRKENRQISTIMQQGKFAKGDHKYVLRVGSLIFTEIGQLSTKKMENFHTSTAIMPIGYKATRIYWALNNPKRRCRYECEISHQSKGGFPLFVTKYKPVASRGRTQEGEKEEDECVRQFTDINTEWKLMLEKLAEQRCQMDMLKLFPQFITGEMIFGLHSPVVCRILESLPNIELCTNYKLKFGRSPILELPLAINPSGCARAEQYIKNRKKNYYGLCKFYLRPHPTTNKLKITHQLDEDLSSDEEEYLIEEARKNTKKFNLMAYLHNESVQPVSQFSE